MALVSKLCILLCGFDETAIFKKIFGARMSLRIIVKSHKISFVSLTEMSALKRFKGSDVEKELEALYQNGLIDPTTTAKEAYQLSLVFKRDVTFDKFQPKYYNWRRKKTGDEEVERTGGNGPPEGTFATFCLSTNSSTNRAVLADVLAGNVAPGIQGHIVANAILPGVQAAVVPVAGRAPFASPVAVGRPVAAGRNSDRKNNAECFNISFMPSFLSTTLRNQQGQRIVEVCIWMQSGSTMDDISLFVSDDMKSLKYQVPMDILMGNGWGLHTDVVVGGERMSREERMMHVRVHHWNAFIDEMRTSDGLLPVFTADIPLPIEVCSKKILRKTGKESREGTRMLVVDLLVEDSKLPATTKRAFELVDDESVWWDSDDLTLNSDGGKK